MLSETLLHNGSRHGNGAAPCLAGQLAYLDCALMLAQHEISAHTQGAGEEREIEERQKQGAMVIAVGVPI